MEQGGEARVTREGWGTSLLACCCYLTIDRAFVYETEEGEGSTRIPIKEALYACSLQ